MLNHKDTKTLISVFYLCAFVIAPYVASAQSAPTEAEAVAAVKLATNPTLKLAAAEDFVARFPNSSARLSIAELIASEILKVKNGAVVLSLLERAQAVFTSQREREIFKPAALEAHVRGERFEDAFALANEILATDPQNLQVLIQLNQAGTEASVKQNRKLADQALQYGLTAISIIEKDIKPPKISDERWAIYKSDLWFCYRNTAILYLGLPAPNTEQTKALSTKAAALKPSEPINFAVLGMALDLEYTKGLEVYEKMAEGASKQEARRQLDGVLDAVIDAWARAVGLAMGRPQHQDLIQRLVPTLTKYYRARNNESTAGLQELVNRYRPAP
jgi:tetratricopeptide (TPR) repeat protein